MLFLIRDVIPFGENIGPTRVAVSLIGMLLAMGPGHGGLQNCTLHVTTSIAFWNADRLLHNHHSVHGPGQRREL